MGGEAAGERKAGFVVEAEDEDAGKPSTIPCSVAGAGGEAAAQLRERELMVCSESQVSASVPQFPFCSPFLSCGDAQGRHQPTGHSDSHQ